MLVAELVFASVVAAEHGGRAGVGVDVVEGQSKRQRLVRAADAPVTVNVVPPARRSACRCWRAQHRIEPLPGERAVQENVAGPGIVVGEVDERAFGQRA